MPSPALFSKFRSSYIKNLNAYDAKIAQPKDNMIKTWLQSPWSSNTDDLKNRNVKIPLEKVIEVTNKISTAVDNLLGTSHIGSNNTDTKNSMEDNAFLESLGTLLTSIKKTLNENQVMTLNLTQSEKSISSEIHILQSTITADQNRVYPKPVWVLQKTLEELIKDPMAKTYKNQLSSMLEILQTLSDSSENNTMLSGYILENKQVKKTETQYPISEKIFKKIQTAWLKNLDEIGDEESKLKFHSSFHEWIKPHITKTEASYVTFRTADPRNKGQIMYSDDFTPKVKDIEKLIQDYAKKFQDSREELITSMTAKKC